MLRNAVEIGRGANMETQIRRSRLDDDIPWDANPGAVHLYFVMIADHASARRSAVAEIATRVFGFGASEILVEISMPR